MHTQDDQQPATSGSAALFKTSPDAVLVFLPKRALTRLSVLLLLLLRIAALDLLASELTDTGLAALSKLPQLRALKLYQAGVTADGLEGFAGQPAGAALHSLVLYGTGALRELSCLGEHWGTLVHTVRSMAMAQRIDARRTCVPYLCAVPVCAHRAAQTSYIYGGEIVTRRHVRSQQEWHCLPRWEPTVKDRC
jgi:hypothetical protein